MIRAFDDVIIPTWEQVYEHTKLNANQTVPVTVDRDGKPLALRLHVPASAKTEDFDLGDAGILPQYLPGPIRWRRCSRARRQSKRACGSAMRLQPSTAMLSFG